MILGEKKISEPKIFFEELGGLHDARITGFSWSKADKSLCIEIDDLNSNFLNLPEYQGLRPVSIIFTAVTCLDCDIKIFNENFCIYDLEVGQEGKCYSVNIRCSPSGSFKCQSEAIKLIEVDSRVARKRDHHDKSE